MKNFNYSVFLLILLGTAVLQSSAQSVQFAARVNKNVLSADDNFQLEISSNSDGKITFPDLSSFRILSGPSRGSFSSYSNINGVVTQSTTYRWTYFLMPKKEGEFTIGSAKLNVDGKEYKTEPIKIKVSKPRDPSYYQQSNRKNIFTSLRVGRSEVYEGEHVVISYTISNQLMRASIEDLEYPNQSGCWMQSIEPPKNGWNSFVESSDGMDYQVTVIRKDILYPNSFGTLKLKPYTLKVLGQDRFSIREYNLTSNAATIQVKPLPPGKPDDFSGAVGQFKMETRISKNSLKANDGIDLTVKISGKGNFMFIEELPLNLPDEMEKYDPEIKEKLSYSEAGTNGSKEFRFLIIPRKKGNYTIGPLRFSYFDPESGKYHTLSSEAFPVEVLPGDGENDLPQTSQASEVEIIDRDIRHLQPIKDDLFSAEDLLFGKALYFLLLLIGPAFYIALLLIRKKNNLSDEEIARNRMKKASQFAIRQLQSAKQKLDQKQIPAFYEEIWKALNGYLSNKLRMETSGMTRANIRYELEQKNASPIHTEEFLNLLEACEMARFGMLNSGSETEIYNRTLELIDQLEASIK